jgi:transposase
MSIILLIDSFHLMQNFTQALERTWSPHTALLHAVDTAHRLTAAAAPVDAVMMIAPATLPQLDARQRAEQKRAQRLKAYQNMRQLHQQGWSTRAIAQNVRLSSRTVQRYLSSPTFPERQGRSDRGRSLLNPYKPYLLQQYNQGRRQVNVLFGEIQKQGYSGSYQTVSRYVRQFAEAQGVRLPAVSVSPIAAGRRFSSPTADRKTAAFLVLRRAETLKADEVQLLHGLTQQTQLALAIRLAQAFAQIVRQRRSEQFDTWLERAEQSELPPFVRFARSLRDDYNAVKAGMTLTASNGQVEGQINRLKMLKRQMYGRAGIELLERRFLLAS